MMNLKDGIRRNCSDIMNEKEIINKFISIYSDKSDPTFGKYSSKTKSFYGKISNWQTNKIVKQFDIRPIQITFEITNKCNCNCKDCGMAANRIKTERSIIDEIKLYKLVDDLYKMGIPAFAITGGEPFLAFDKMCSMITYSKDKVDISKIISNGFWGNNVEYYFKKLEKSGLFNNKFFVPSLQISIGEQTVPLESICNIINYVAKNYKINDLNLGIIHTRQKNLKETRLEQLYKIYCSKFGEFPKNRVYLTDSYYVNSNPLATEKLDVETESVYNELILCDNTFCQEIGTFVSSKIFMKCNGDCYPCEVFNLHQSMYLGNYFKDGLNMVLQNYNSNKYVRFIKNYGTVGFRDVIPKRILENQQCETPCYACEYCIKFCEENRLIR